MTALIIASVFLALFIVLSLLIHRAPIMHEGKDGMHYGRREDCQRCKYQDYLDGKELDPRE